MALREIGETEVLALMRRPETSADAYLAMVEENEIRAGMSFYERARLAAEAAKLGIYPDPAAAIAALFTSASPAKRSKIGSFVRVHEALGDALRYPTAIPERLGLALAAALDRDERGF
jgi:ParB family chromosome partitioning protein